MKRPPVRTYNGLQASPTSYAACMELKHANAFFVSSGSSMENCLSVHLQWLLSYVGARRRSRLQVYLRSAWEKWGQTNGEF